MNCDEFQAALFPFIDGELPGAQRAAAETHATACGDCGARAEFERALESRIGIALLSDAATFDAAAAVAAAQNPSPTPVADVAGGAEVATDAPPSGRVLRAARFRRLVAVAAALLVAVQSAWFFCIPPFECQYLEAVEAAVHQPGTALRPGVAAPAIAARLPIPGGPPGLKLLGDAALVDVSYESASDAVRASCRTATGEPLTVVWSEPNGSEPSFRRKRTINNQVWWIAEENGHVLVAWMCPMTRTLCTLVGDLGELRLLEIARTLRPGER